VAAQTPEPKGIRGLLSLLVEQVSELARLYFAAAWQEVGAGLNQLKVAAVLGGIALILIALAAVVLVVLMVSVISAVFGIAMWAAALIVLLGLLLLAALCGWLAYRRLRHARLMPDETIAAAREDLEWAQHWTKRG
jgi:uncharacterized membrane protein YqjE